MTSDIPINIRIADVINSLLSYKQPPAAKDIVAHLMRLTNQTSDISTFPNWEALIDALLPLQTISTDSDTYFIDLRGYSHRLANTRLHSIVEGNSDSRPCK